MIKLSRRNFIYGTAASLLSASGATASPVSWIIETLSDVASDPFSCGAKDAAVQGTLKRLNNVQFPTNGKLLVVNIASGVVTAYTEGIPVIESRGVVGMDLTPTPELVTRVSYVRPNPTWTVPESIIRRKSWREKLENDPSFFEENGFDLIIGGKAASPFVAADMSKSVSAFVQRPSPTNALGLLKIGLHNADGIYLHDTNEPSRYEADVRAGSAGCVRIEKVRDVAGWILGHSKEHIDELIDDNNRQNFTPPNKISVILGYWTAWPDATGAIQYYPDIYGWDGEGVECAGIPLRSNSGVHVEHSPLPNRLNWIEQ